MVSFLKSNEKLCDLFTKREEYEPLKLDQYQRFPYYLSEYRNILEPIISNFLIQNGLKVEYPNGKNFAVCLTHDVDIVNLTKLELACNTASLLRKFQMRKIIRKFNQSPIFTRIMNLEERYDSKSSFYLMAIKEDNLDYNYDVGELKNELRNLIDNGWEVGLHGGHEAYNDLNEINEEKRRLEKVVGKKVIGYRNHYLRFKVPTTWTLLEKAGFKYDVTFGYNDCVGFRNGMCHPFKPFNLYTNNYIGILEIPLIIMDTTLYVHMHMNTRSAWKIIKRLIDAVEECRGVITILWHNYCFFDKELKFYKKILAYCYKKNAWLTSGNDIWKWWDKNKIFETWMKS